MARYGSTSPHEPRATNTTRRPPGAAFNSGGGTHVLRRGRWKNPCKPRVRGAGQRHRCAAKEVAETVPGPGCRSGTGPLQSEARRRIFGLLAAGLSGPPVTVSRTVRTGQHDLVTVRIAQPNLPVIGTAITIGRVSKAGQNDLHPHRFGPRYRRIEIVDFEPQGQPIAGGPIVRVADSSMMVLHFPPMQLQHQPAGGHEAFVIRAAVVALA